MADSVVIDASALAAVVFNEPASADVRTAIGGRSLCAPRLLPFEIANVAWKKATRRPEDTPMILAAFRAAQTVDIRLLDVNLGQVFVLALTNGLTAYDACYLWLAAALNARLVTLDRRLFALAGPAS